MVACQGQTEREFKSNGVEEAEESKHAASTKRIGNDLETLRLTWGAPFAFSGRSMETACGLTGAGGASLRSSPAIAYR